jgi:ribosomal protein L3
MVFLQLKDAAAVAAFQPGQKLEIAEMFKAGDNIDIAGTTVGKGFQGEQHQHRCSKPSKETTAAAAVLEQQQWQPQQHQQLWQRMQCCSI